MLYRTWFPSSSSSLSLQQSSLLDLLNRNISPFSSFKSSMFFLWAALSLSFVKSVLLSVLSFCKMFCTSSYSACCLERMWWEKFKTISGQNGQGCLASYTLLPLLDLLTETYIFLFFMSVAIHAFLFSSNTSFDSFPDNTGTNSDWSESPESGITNESSSSSEIILFLFLLMS